MKRFYSSAATELSENGSNWLVTLDGRNVRTPGKTVLALPNETLATMVAEEWNAAGDTIDIGAMVHCGLANAAIDHAANNPEAFRKDLLAFGETDTLCYRAEPGDALLARQDEMWEPLTIWAETTFGIRLNRVSGVMHTPHPPETAVRYAEILMEMCPFQLVALSRIAALSGSLIIALAALDANRSADTLWSAANLEEDWQAELWGQDSEASTAQEAKRLAFVQAVKFLRAARN